MSRHRILKVAMFIPGLVAVACGVAMIVASDHLRMSLVLLVGIFLLFAAAKKLWSGEVFGG